MPKRTTQLSSNVTNYSINNNDEGSERATAKPTPPSRVNFAYVCGGLTLTILGLATAAIGACLAAVNRSQSSSNSTNGSSSSSLDDSTAKFKLSVTLATCGVIIFAIGATSVVTTLACRSRLLNSGANRRSPSDAESARYPVDNLSETTPLISSVTAAAVDVPKAPDNSSSIPSAPVVNIHDQNQSAATSVSGTVASEAAVSIRPSAVVSVDGMPAELTPQPQAASSTVVMKKEYQPGKEEVLTFIEMTPKEFAKFHEYLEKLDAQAKQNPAIDVWNDKRYVGNLYIVEYPLFISESGNRDSYSVVYNIENGGGYLNERKWIISREQMEEALQPGELLYHDQDHHVPVSSLFNISFKLREYQDEASKMAFFPLVSVQEALCKQAKNIKQELLETQKALKAIPKEASNNTTTPNPNTEAEISAATSQYLPDEVALSYVRRETNLWNKNRYFTATEVGAKLLPDSLRDIGALYVKGLSQGRQHQINGEIIQAAYVVAVSKKKFDQLPVDWRPENAVFIVLPNNEDGKVITEDQSKGEYFEIYLGKNKKHSALAQCCDLGYFINDENCRIAQNPPSCVSGILSLQVLFHGIERVRTEIRRGLIRHSNAMNKDEFEQTKVENARLGGLVEDFLIAKCQFDNNDSTLGDCYYMVFYAATNTSYYVLEEHMQEALKCGGVLFHEYYYPKKYLEQVKEKLAEYDRCFTEKKTKQVAKETKSRNEAQDTAASTTASASQTVAFPGLPPSAVQSPGDDDSDSASTPRVY